jgi:predicted Zn-dependent protease
VNVFYSERINGHTDGREVWITSQLMRTVADDVNLALVVAHEMAHAIAGHNMEVPTKALELEADRMALIMLSRGGYDIGRAVDYWQHAPHPHDPGQSVSKTHPSMGERFNNFRRVQREIETRLARGETLTFDPA